MRVLAFLRRALPPIALGATSALGCYDSGRGLEPDDRRPYFPTGIALSESGRTIFLANSDFDLRFNRGTVQALDVAKIAARARVCSDSRSTAEYASAEFDDCRRGWNEWDAPLEAPNQYLRGSVRIGAFATDLANVPLGQDRGRLLVTVRGDASLTAIDYTESADGVAMTCTNAGSAPFGQTCSSEYRIGTDLAQSTRGLRLEGEPFAVAVHPFAPVVAGQTNSGIAAVIHQASGNVSLFTNVTGASARDVRLTFAVGNLPAGGTDVSPLDWPRPVAGEPYFPRFLVTSRSQANVYVLQYYPDENEGRAGLVATEAIPIATQSTGVDSRGIVVDPPSDDPPSRPARVFLTNRSPFSLVVGRIDPGSGRLSFYENVPLPIGASRIQRAVIDGRTLILAISYDTRSLVVYDPDARRVSNVLTTDRGPHSIVADAATKLAFLGNFTDSTVQVVELDRTRGEYLRIIYNVGIPSAPAR
jgi:hypothetical protein